MSRYCIARRILAQICLAQICLALLLLSSSARAAATGRLTLQYTGYSHGLVVLKLDGDLDLTPTAYAAHVTFHTVGLARWIMRSDNDSQADGYFKGMTVLPLRFHGTGYFHGGPRLTDITYQNDTPTIRALTPPAATERTPVPPAMTTHTIDDLSAVALLIRSVGLHNNCDGTVTTFDGRRLATQTSHTAGIETLPRTDRSSFAGPALRCDFTGLQLAGFVRDQSEDRLKKPRHGAAWLATLVPDAPPVPVRVDFDNRFLGQVTLYLTGFTAAPK